jgi:hypothetical protein
MPTAIIPIIASYVSSTAIATAIYYVAVIAVTMAYSESQRRKAAAAARDAWNASLKDRLNMTGGSVDPRQIVLGRVRKSGSMVYRASVGANREKFITAIALAGHEIDGVEAIFFNDVEVTLDEDGLVQTAPYSLPSVESDGGSAEVVDGVGSLVLSHPPIDGSVSVFVGAGGDTGSDPFPLAFSVTGTTLTIDDDSLFTGTAWINYQFNTTHPTARVHWHLGTDDQTADARMMELLPGEWTSEHRLRGIAYLVVELDYNQDVYSSGLPNISAVIRGAKVYDPRTGTTAWSSNPALLLRHYAQHPLGGNLGEDGVNDAHCIAAANACDVSTDYTVVRDGVEVTETRKLYEAGTVFTSGVRPADSINELCEAMAGKWCFVGNELIMRAGQYVSPSMSLGDADFGDSAGIIVQPQAAREHLVNLVTGTFADEFADYKIVDFPAVNADTYIEIDGAELPLETELTAVTHVGQAQQVSAVMLRDARQALVITAPFKLAAYPLQVFDTVTLTSSRYGWTSKVFEVVGRKWTLEGLIELTLKETDPSIFAFGSSFSAVDVAPNSNLPLPWVVPQVTGVVVTSGTTELTDGSIITRTRVSWDSVAAESVLQSGDIEVQFAEVTGDALAWSTWPEEGDATSTIIPGLKAGYLYVFRVRAVNTIGVRGVWSAQVTHQVAFTPIIDVEVAWPDVTDPDGTKPDDNATRNKLWRQFLDPAVSPGGVMDGDSWLQTDESGDVVLASYDRIAGAWVLGYVSPPPELTPPPNVSGLTVTAGLTQILVQWTAPSYTSGHGHRGTIIYAAHYDADDPTLPTFADASQVAVADFELNIISIPSETNTRWHVWAKFQTIDGVSSTTPAGGTNGVTATTGLDVSALLDVLEGEITETQLYSGLGARIDQIEPLATSVYQLQLVDAVNATSTLQSLVTAYQINQDAQAAFAVAREEMIARVSADVGAEAIARLSLAATVDANTASIATEASARASADGSLFAQYTVKLDVNGYVSGFGLASTATNATPTSSFVVRSDSFSIASPSGPGITPIVPFITRTTSTTVNGVTVPVGVYMDAAYIENGSITNAKIGNAAIDNAKIANLDAAKITTGTLDAARISAGSITTDKITVGAASVASSSQDNYLSTTLSSTATDAFPANVDIVTLTTTGSPVSVHATYLFNVDVGSTSCTAVAFEGGLRIDGTRVKVTQAYPRTLRVLSNSRTRANVACPIIWRGTLAAGSHTFTADASVSLLDVNGAPVAAGLIGGGVTSNTFDAIVSFIVEENKV